jgi:4-amino-4-deoxy-L-arabinose transferase-like glycosyltransferase
VAAMNRSYSPLQKSSDRIFQPLDRADIVWLLLLTLAALFLHVWRLDHPRLSDIEQNFQQDVIDFWHSPANQHRYLSLLIASSAQITTLLHRVTAWFYAHFGVSPLTTRLPGACLAASATPLLYLLGRELFLRRPAALLAACVFLTQWAVLQQGRMASLQSIPLCTSLAIFYCLLRSRRDLRWTLGFGFLLGLHCLLDPVGGSGLGAVVLLFLLWDTPRLLGAKHFWWGTGLGLLAIVIVTGIQQEINDIPFWNLQPWNDRLDFLSYGPQIQTAQPLQILTPLFAVLPWLLFWPVAGWFTWQYAQFSWGKLCLIWGGASLIGLLSGYLSVMQLYAVLALTCGAYLAQFWNLATFTGLPVITQEYSPFLRWTPILATVAAWGLVAYELWQGRLTSHWVTLSAAVTATTSCILMTQNQDQWLFVLLWGTCCTLAVFLQTAL